MSDMALFPLVRLRLTRFPSFPISIILSGGEKVKEGDAKIILNLGYKFGTLRVIGAEGAAGLPG